ncbi:telomerase reverse transcriptase-like [Anticarsia gemmatalis]|uniref:telomerase reverse transcriptase-like n=1 Tax=Anticarsia gemmatalis TaxID=129554 RepID=UPI003F76DF0B
MDILDIPVCVSQYFVNKQNVRSFGNIIKWKYLRKQSEESCFVKLIFEDNSLVSEFPDDFLRILSCIRTNLRNNSKEDFRNYFPKEESLSLQPVDKKYVFTNCWKALCEIVPRQFFGCNQNSKIMKNLVLAVVYSMKRQCIMLDKVLSKWDMSVLPWKAIQHPKKILHIIILWILRNILAPIICLNFHVTTCKLDANENKLYYFWKQTWQGFYDKQISKMVFTKIIKKFEPYSMGKKSRRNHSLANRIKLKMLKKDIPKLHLTLKPHNDCRPIVCYKNNSQTTSEKYKIRDRLRFLRSLAGKSTTKIENEYSSLYTKWVNKNKPKLYFVKTDLSNAFGSINREKLSKIVAERYLSVLKAEPCVSKKKRIAQQYKDVITELHKPILIRAGSTVYEWREGLVQGYKYSPALSELYYSYLDEIYLAKHLKVNEDEVKLFVRVVDDYLYITDSLEDAKSFLDALSNYRNVNLGKTVVNFPHDSIKFSEDIVFLGNCYNTTTMQVSRANNIYAGQMCYKIAFTNGLSDLPKFIESRIGQSGIQINSHIFNLHYNNEELVWKHVFNTFCLSANKFCTILAILCDEKEMKSFIQLYKKRIFIMASFIFVCKTNAKMQWAGPTNK